MKLPFHSPIRSMLAKRVDKLPIGDVWITEKNHSTTGAGSWKLSSARQQCPSIITPATSNLAVARDWFERFEGVGMDVVVTGLPLVKMESRL
jgi:hypothetical protein